jgi:hypothetical protein
MPGYWFQQIEILQRIGFMPIFETIHDYFLKKILHAGQPGTTLDLQLYKISYVKLLDICCIMATRGL